jgi:hypothetical protein
VVIAADINLSFTPTPEDACSAPLSASDAYQASNGTAKIPPSETVQYGTITMPVLSPTADAGSAQYRFHNQPVWAFSFYDCLSPVGVPMVDPTRAKRCVTYSFLDASTGQQLMMTQQR